MECIVLADLSDFCEVIFQHQDDEYNSCQSKWNGQKDVTQRSIANFQEQLRPNQERLHYINFVSKLLVLLIQAFIAPCNSHTSYSLQLSKT